MKIVFIIYVVSWIILICIYTINHLRHKTSNDVEKKYLVLAGIILLAPIIVVGLIITGLSSFFKGRKQKKVLAEYDRKKEEEENYKRASLSELNNAIAKYPQKGSLSEYARVAHNLSDCLSPDNDYQYIMKPLHNISLPKGTSLHVERCETKWPGDVSKLYVKTIQGAKDYQIWDYVNVEDNEKSVWEAYLLYTLWHSLPLCQHGLYAKRTYFYDTDDIGFKDKTMETSIKQSFVAPQVVKGANKYYVICCYWSNFGGFKQETVEIILNNGKASFKDIENKTLYKYDCGIRF